MTRTSVQLVAAFASAAASSVALHASDTPTAILARVAQYQQTSASSPKLLASLPYMFIAEGENFSAGDINLMSVTLPTTGVFDVEPQSDGGDTERFQFQGRYTSLSSFNSAFPAGNYSLTFVPSDGDNVKLAMSIKATTFPAAPKVTNYPAAQSIDPTKSFTLTWDAFAGATTKDRILFGIQGGDDDYEFISTGSPAGPAGAASGSLAATTKSFVIAAGSLPPGSNLTAQIIFVHADVQSSITHGYYASGTAALTQVKLHTAGSLDRTAPKVASSTPKNGATGVATNATVTITFNEAMRSKWGWNINFSNLAASYPTIAWKDNKTLTIAAPAGGWPKGRKIGVMLNPPGTGGTLLQDLSRNVLPSTTISFTTKS